MLKSIFTTLIPIVLLSATAMGQDDDVKGGVYKKTNSMTKKFAPYTPLTERDVMWSKRIWRTMDLKEKINHPFYFPTESHGSMNSLFSVIRNHIKASELTVYDAIDDEFTIELTRTAAQTIGDQSEIIYIEDELTGELIGKEIPNPLYSGDVMRFRIKEDWFFDRQRSVMDVRIIGICPVIEVKDSNDDYKGELPMYWVYFPEVRPMLARQRTINRWNDAEQRNYDDLFVKRFFSSYVYKESNVYNRRVTDYKAGIDALIEAQDIHNKIANFEQDLWEY